MVEPTEGPRTAVLVLAVGSGARYRPDVSSLFKTLPDPAAPARRDRARVDPWIVALGALAGLLVLGGTVTVAVGLHVVGGFEGTVLGQDQRFDTGVATAIVGGAAIALGVLVGTCWLVLGSVSRVRRPA